MYNFLSDDDLEVEDDLLQPKKRIGSSTNKLTSKVLVGLLTARPPQLEYTLSRQFRTVAGQCKVKVNCCPEKFQDKPHVF